MGSSPYSSGGSPYRRGVLWERLAQGWRTVIGCRPMPALQTVDGKILRLRPGFGVELPAILSVTRSNNGSLSTNADGYSCTAQTHKKTPRLWRCNWCVDQRLKATGFFGVEWLLLFALCRPYYCPHCKGRFYRLIGG